jgi:hypothetical protein
MAKKTILIVEDSAVILRLPKACSMSKAFPRCLFGFTKVIGFG